MDMLDYVWLGILSVFHGPAMFELFGIPVPTALVMVAAGFFTGVLVGATPGLAGPMAMAVALPILISIFGFETAALLPVSVLPVTLRSALPWFRIAKVRLELAVTGTAP